MSFEDEAAGVALQAGQRLFWDGVGRLTSGVMLAARMILRGSWHAVRWSFDKAEGAASDAWQAHKREAAFERMGVVPEYARGPEGRAAAWFDPKAYYRPVDAQTAAALDQLAFDGLVDAGRARAADTMGRAHQLINEVEGHYTFVKGLDNPMDPRAHGSREGRKAASELGRRHPEEAAFARQAGRRSAGKAEASSKAWRDPAFYNSPATDDQRGALERLCNDGKVDARLARAADTVGAAHALINTDPDSYQWVRGLDDPLDPRAPEGMGRAWLEEHPAEAGREPWDDLAHPPFSGEGDEEEPTQGEFVVEQVGDDVAVPTQQGGNARGRARGRRAGAPRAHEDGQERVEEARASELVVGLSIESPAVARALRDELAEEAGVAAAVAEKADGTAELVVNWPAERAGALAARLTQVEGLRNLPELQSTVARAKAAAAGSAPSAAAYRGPSLGGAALGAQRKKEE